MQSKAAEHDAEAQVDRLQPPALQIVDELPYQPSVPCARCARGVDPLRAACVSACERGFQYFCSRACITAFRAAEAAHAEQQARSAAARQGVRVEPRTRSLPIESVARRVEPPKPETPLWPLWAVALALLMSLLPVVGADRVATLAVVGIAAAFSSRTTLSRSEGGLVGWLAAPLGVALLGLAALLEERPSLLVAAAAGVALMWLRERLVERAEGLLMARRQELAARLAPRVWVAVPGSSERQERLLSSLRIGDEVRVEAQEAIPVDGSVVAGTAEVLPYPEAREGLTRSVGDAVLAGAFVASGWLDVRAARVGSERTLFAALEPAPADDAFLPSLQLAAHARNVGIALLPLVPAVVLALITAPRAVNALASCAAALLALPVLAAARGARVPYRMARIQAAVRGLCFRDVRALDRAGTVDTVAIRVEGALVPRTYALVELCPLTEDHDAAALLTLALSAELAAEEHGIARAIQAYAERLGVQPIALRRLGYARGRGVTALTDGEGALVVGNREALLSAGVSVAVADREAQRAEQAGRRVVFLALDGHVRGLLVFEQAVRLEARVAVQTLFDLGLEVALLSGDHRATVEAVARPLDVAHVKAELSAAQRAAEVRRLREGDSRVAVVGLLPADEALLGAADVALCLDAAHLSGERAITTAGRDLRDAAAALAIARRARRSARVVRLAVGAGCALLLTAAGGVLHPIVVVIAAFAVDVLALARESSLSDAASGPKSK